jgi:2,4-dienoyl-CoA reductase-like NADH-dependent reductase (Old Yellow Enzyme family)
MAARPSAPPKITVSSSATPFGDGWHVPRALTRDEIDATVQAFVHSARRAVRIGFEGWRRIRDQIRTNA